MTEAEKNAKLDELEAAMDKAAEENDRDAFEGFFAEYIHLSLGDWVQIR